MVNVHTQWTIERTFLSCYNSGGVGVIFIWCLKRVITRYAKASLYQLSFNEKIHGLLIEHFDFYMMSNRKHLIVDLYFCFFNKTDIVSLSIFKPWPNGPTSSRKWTQVELA